MTMKPESYDAAASSSGILVSVWNFVLGGDFNTLLGTAVGILSVVVLIQRWRINRKKLQTESAEK